MARINWHKVKALRGLLRHRKRVYPQRITLGKMPMKKMTGEEIKLTELRHGVCVFLDHNMFVLRAERMAEWPSEHHWIVFDKDMFLKLLKFATSIGWMDHWND